MTTLRILALVAGMTALILALLAAAMLTLAILALVFRKTISTSISSSRLQRDARLPKPIDSPPSKRK